MRFSTSTISSLSLGFVAATTIFHQSLVVDARKVRGDMMRGNNEEQQQQLLSRRALKSKKGGDGENEIFSFGDDFDCNKGQVEQFLPCDTDPILVTDDIDIKGDLESCIDDGSAVLFEISSKQNDIVFDCQGHALTLGRNADDGGQSAIEIVNIDNDITIKNCLIIGNWFNGINLH